MFAFKVDNAWKEWGGKRLFENISLEVTVGEKAVLLGRNGVGKTTLVEALMRTITLDGGTIQYGIPLEEWGWMEQFQQVAPVVTLADYVKSGNEGLCKLQGTIAALQHRLEQESAQDVDQTARTAEQYSELLDRYNQQGGYAWEVHVEETLARLKLPVQMWNTPYEDLSGGQKTRAQIARLMVKKPKMLVLDEPTNHLDAETLMWLADWVQSYDGTVLMITHDRYFMDNVADTTIEMTPGGCKKYKGGYQSYRTQRDLEAKTQQALYDKQESEREALREAIQQYRQWYERGHNAASERDPGAKKRAMKNATRYKAKEKALERLEEQRVEKPLEHPQARIDFQVGRFEARTLAVLEDVGVRFGSLDVFSSVYLNIERGQRIALIGPNGAGKSTLLKVLTGQLNPASGAVRHHPQLRIGYFDQELRTLDPSKTVLDTLLMLPGMTQSHARTILAGFLFRKEDVFKYVGDLSMGERCRVAFVQLYFSEANLLVLDEPTNYLDIDTRERVEEALSAYPGALVVVSHDRYLLSRVANRVVSFGAEGVEYFQGSYEAYMEPRETKWQLDKLRADLSDIVTLTSNQNTRHE